MSQISKIVENFLSLGILQIINYAVPLITFPYLVHVLGIEGFGLYSFIIAVINYGVLATEYGFDLSATKHISINLKNKEKLDEIFSSVIIIKSIVAFIFLIILLLLTLFFDRFSKDSYLYFIAFGLVIGQVLFPVWFFQGIEKMRYITILNALAKIIFTIAIFIFVNSKDDLVYAFLFNSLGSVIAGLLAINIAIKDFGIKLSWQALERIIFYIKDGWYIFTSRVAVQLYQSANIIVLGLMTNNTLVGYYTIAYKIVSALSNIFSVANSALYPYISKLYVSSKEKFFKQNIYLSIGLFFMMLPVAIVVYIYAPKIIELISGKEANDTIVYLLRVLAPMLTIILYGGQFTNILVILDKSKILNNVVIIAGIINILLVVPIIYLFSVKGVVWLNVFIMLYIAFTKGYFVYGKFRKKELL